MRPSAPFVLVACATALLGACQTPTSITFAVQSDVDCASLGQRSVGMVVGRADEVADVLEPTTTKACTVSPDGGDLAPVGTVVALPAGDEAITLGMKVILGVTRSTDRCGVEPDVDGTPWGGCIIARRRLSFLAGEALTVDVPLYQECIGIPCDEDQTCVPARGCVDATVRPEDCTGAGCGVNELGTGASSSATTGNGAGGGDTSSTSQGPSSTSSGAGGQGAGGQGAGGQGAGGQGAGGQGGGPACVTADECIDPPDECVVGNCVNGACVEEVRSGLSCTLNGTAGAGQCTPTGQCCLDGNCDPSANGAFCAAASECVSGHCVDGYCCDAACDQECMSCRAEDTEEPNGTCAAVRSGLDPAGECPGMCSYCGGGAGCLGNIPCPGSCEMAPNQTTCIACLPGGRYIESTCMGQVCEVNQGAPPMVCPGSFKCVAPEGCLGQCQTDSDCFTGSCTPQGHCR